MDELLENIRWLPKWVRLLLYISCFCAGGLASAFVSYVTYTGKVDVLSQELQQLTNIVGDMNKKMDQGNDKWIDIDKRVSILEAEKNKK